MHRKINLWIYFVGAFVIFFVLGYDRGKIPANMTEYHGDQALVIDNALGDYTQRKMQIDGIGGAFVLGIKPIQATEYPNHCDMISENHFKNRPELFNWVIVAQKHTIFKIPIGKMYFTCGGNQYTKTKPKFMS